MENEDTNIIKEPEVLISEVSTDVPRELSLKETSAKILDKLNNMDNTSNIKPIPTKKPLFTFPAKWNKTIEQNSVKPNTIVVLYLNKQGYMEPPIVTKIIDGDVIVIKQKVHFFDPKSMWLHQIGKNIHKIYIVREIDRLPVNNLDAEQIKASTRSTLNDETLFKYILSQKSDDKIPKKVPWGIIIIVGVVLIIGLGWFFMSGTGGGAAASAASTAAAAVTP